jgi:DNA-binding HxlR family transcriptional regulator
MSRWRRPRVLPKTKLAGIEGAAALGFGPCRFQDFERSLAGISPNTLSARLKRLEEHGIVERRFYEQHPPRAEYGLTDKGRQLGPVLKTLLDWGRKHTAMQAAARGDR